LLGANSKNLSNCIDSFQVIILYASTIKVYSAPPFLHYCLPYGIALRNPIRAYGVAGKINNYAGGVTDGGENKQNKFPACTASIQE